VPALDKSPPSALDVNFVHSSAFNVQNKKLVMPYNERIGDAAQRTLNENPQNINNIWLESENSEVEIKAVFKNQLSVIS